MELNRKCPTHHVDWLCGDCWVELYDGFDGTLTAAQQTQIETISHRSNRCASEWAGFDCEMAVSLDAYIRLGLLKKFTDYGCRNYTCEAAALCTGPGIRTEIGK